MHVPHIMACKITVSGLKIKSASKQGVILYVKHKMGTLNP
jgi:hypothetical protein